MTEVKRMRNVYLEIDEDALAEAQVVLGTSTMKETVNTALVEVAQRVKRLRALAELREAAADGSMDPLLDKRTYRGGSTRFAHSA
jgi:Arc/MetJ family transcription regulator